jgi:hypothetical protein
MAQIADPQNRFQRALLILESSARETGAELLGMSRDAHDQIASEITHIFHGAWPMNFQSKVTSFAMQIKALRDLIDLARLVCPLNYRLLPNMSLLQWHDLSLEYMLFPSSTIQ